MDGSASNMLSFEAGDVIYREGDLGKDTYIIQSGRVEIFRTMGDGDVVLESLGANEFLGEMALFGNPRRMVNVRAAGPTQLLVINRRMLNAQFHNIPDWLVNMIKTIADRIMSTGKGVKAQFDVSLEYSALSIINLLAADIGESLQKGVSVPLDAVRGEVVSLLGVDENALDALLKKLTFVSIIKVKGGQNQLVVPDVDRLDKYLKYLVAKVKGGVMPQEINSDTQKGFERIDKLLKTR